MDRILSNPGWACAQLIVCSNVDFHSPLSKYLYTCFQEVCSHSWSQVPAACSLGVQHVTWETQGTTLGNGPFPGIQGLKACPLQEGSGLLPCVGRNLPACGSGLTQDMLGILGSFVSEGSFVSGGRGGWVR